MMPLREHVMSSSFISARGAVTISSHRIIDAETHFHPRDRRTDEMQRRTTTTTTAAAAATARARLDVQRGSTVSAEDETGNNGGGTTTRGGGGGGRRRLRRIVRRRTPRKPTTCCPPSSWPRLKETVVGTVGVVPPACVIFTVFSAFATLLVYTLTRIDALASHEFFLRGRRDDFARMNALPAYPVVTRGGAANANLSAEAVDTCHRTLWHTVETTTVVLPGEETFVMTGDIDDLWLRDSAAQVHPLLVPVLLDDSAKRRRSLIRNDPRLDRIVGGLIKRHAMYIRHDPYANAFRIDDSYVFSEEQRLLGRHDLISTWNYELDSACYTFRLIYYYWKQSANPDPVLRLPAVQEAVEIMVDVWIAEQRHELDAVPSGPLFDDCANCRDPRFSPYRYPGLSRGGKGGETNASAGLTWTGFRPSDDGCVYGYLVPANMFAYAVLGYVMEMCQRGYWNRPDIVDKADRLRRDIRRGIEEHAVVEHEEFGRIYAYEVDGLGHSLLMDDANVPSLLSIPYLGYPYDPDVYANTRRFILSPSNPEYHAGTNSLTGPVEGVGSPHMSARIRQNVWPMSMAVQALTTDDLEEKVRLTEQLVRATAGTGWMHESFDVRNPKQFTRSWFCWADSLFAELVMSLTDACPDPASRKYKVLEWRDPVQVQGGPFAAIDS